jgi:hypothetical protein
MVLATVENAFMADFSTSSYHLASLVKPMPFSFVFEKI